MKTEIEFQKRKYEIIRNTNNYVELKDIESDYMFRIKKGTVRYCQIFGGNPTEIEEEMPMFILKPDHSNRNVEKPEDMLIKFIEDVRKDKGAIDDYIERYPDMDKAIVILLLCYYYKDSKCWDKETFNKQNLKENNIHTMEEEDVNQIIDEFEEKHLKDKTVENILNKIPNIERET